MAKESCKRPAKKVKKTATQKYRFELAPSKIPIDYKRLWDLEDELIKGLTTSGITPFVNNSISTYISYFSSMYSTEYLWLDYSYCLYYIYEIRSVNCYVNIRNIDYIQDVYKSCIDSLTSDLVCYYRNILSINDRGIKKGKIRDTCVWFVYHLNRARSQDSLGVKASYDKDFYSQFQDDKLVSGRVVKNLIDMLEFNNCIYKFKGYCLKENANKDSRGRVTYSGDTKSATTLLVFNNEKVCKYFHKSPISIKDNKKFIPKKSSKAYVEVRCKSKSKEIIAEEDYPVDWIDKIKESEKVMRQLDDKLRNSTVEIGGYVIPELFFRRIWIGDLSNYGRVHDDGGFQTKSKDLRKTVIIDGLPTVTIDLSSIHPRYLYSIEGIELDKDFDPYPCLDIKLDQKRINKFKKFYGLEKYNPLRNLAKISLLILLNATDRVAAKHAIQNKIRKDNKKGMTYQERYMSFIGIPSDVDIDNVIDQLMDHNKPISKYFATGASGMLMNKDSDIIVSALDKLMQLDCAALPLHDSLTVREDFLEEAVLALEYGYKEVVGSLINFKYEIE